MRAVITFAVLALSAACGYMPPMSPADAVIEACKQLRTLPLDPEDKDVRRARLACEALDLEMRE